MENKAKHLEMIQGVINRLGSNSFRIKSWTVVLVAALLSVLVREERLAFALIALFPVLVFWGLDGYFLGTERRFRTVYDSVRRKPESKIDFAMDTPPLTAADWFRAARSVTLRVFYPAIIVSVILLSVSLGGNQV